MSYSRLAILTGLSIVLACCSPRAGDRPTQSVENRDAKTPSPSAPVRQPAPITYDEPELAKLKPGEYTWNPERAPSGPVVVLVSIPQQEARIYRNAILIGRTTVSTGRKGHGTPTGVFHILQKDKRHHSSTYNNAPMPNMQRLTWDGVALHAGNLPGYPASHGCVRMPLKFSDLLFNTTSQGGTVVIADNHSAPREVVYPGMALLSASFEATDTANIPEVSKEQSFWQPERSPEGPVSILMSYAEGIVCVYRNGTLIGRAAIRVKDPDQPLEPSVFVVMEGFSSEKNVYVPDKPLHRWMGVSFSKPGEEAAVRKDILDRVRVPKDFARQVYDLIQAGTTLVVTDLPVTAEASTPPKLTVLTSES